MMSRRVCADALGMRVVPRNKQPQIQFFLTRLEPWTDHAVQIGTTPEMVATLVDQTEAARAAYAEQQQAQQAALNATLRCQIAVDRMAATGAAIISQVRAQAAMNGNGVYSLASISPAAKASPIGQPGKPSAFTFAIDGQGVLTLQWKCKHPRGAVGTIYEVHRRVGNGELVYLGTTGEKRFVDQTIPSVPQIVYQVRAIRSTAIGDWATFNVNFGTTSATAVARVAKLAA
jgi:hypothetical protein